MSMESKKTLPGTHVPNLNTFWQVTAKIYAFEKLAFKTLTQCEENINVNKNADKWSDYNSSPCTKYTQANNKWQQSQFYNVYLLAIIQIWMTSVSY